MPLGRTTTALAILSLASSCTRDAADEQSIAAAPIPEAPIPEAPSPTVGQGGGGGTWKPSPMHNGGSPGAPVIEFCGMSIPDDTQIVWCNHRPGLDLGRLAAFPVGRRRRRSAALDRLRGPGFGQGPRRGRDRRPRLSRPRSPRLAPGAHRAPDRRTPPRAAGSGRPQQVPHAAGPPRPGPRGSRPPRRATAAPRTPAHRRHRAPRSTAPHQSPPTTRAQPVLDRRHRPRAPARVEPP